MSLLDKFFKKKKEVPIESNRDFWTWFKTRERDFYQVIKEQGDVETEFFNQLSLKLNELKEGYWFLAGMVNDYMAELIITADGIVENIPFVEDLVKDAPHIPGWKITALKPSSDIENVSIQMDNYQFNKDNLNFQVNEHSRYPDEIDLTIVYKNYREEGKALMEYLYSWTIILVSCAQLRSSTPLKLSAMQIRRET